MASLDVSAFCDDVSAIDGLRTVCVSAAKRNADASGSVGGEGVAGREAGGI